MGYSELMQILNEIGMEKLSGFNLRDANEITIISDMEKGKFWSSATP